MICIYIIIFLIRIVGANKPMGSGFRTEVAPSEIHTLGLLESLRTYTYPCIEVAGSDGPVPAMGFDHCHISNEAN